MIALTLLLLAPSAHAYQSGKTGSSTGCGSCHGSTADSTTAARLMTPGLVVAPGELLSLELIVSSTDKNREAVGMNVSVDGGTLLAGANTQSSGGEITHSSPELLFSGSATFFFDWIAPSQEGEVVFLAAGNAVDGNGLQSGDGWNTTGLLITVEDGCRDLDGDSVTDCDGDCDDANASIYPGAQEVCNGDDDNCDGTIDNNAVDAQEGYVDADGDGFGNDDLPGEGCIGSGYAVEGGDCNDADASIYPGAEEIGDDGIDQDCDGEDEDDDDDDPDSGGDSGEEDSNKSSTACSAISGVFGIGTLWLGAVGILRRKEV